ncbi:hypothetical protein D3C86_1731580 [compost metagenome]
MGFACRGLLQGFAVLHKAGRQGPVTAPRLDGAPAQQYALAPHRQAAGNDARVLVVNGVAVLAHMAQAIVALGNSKGHGAAALAAELHGESSWLPHILARDGGDGKHGQAPHRHPE